MAIKKIRGILTTVLGIVLYAGACFDLYYVITDVSEFNMTFTGFLIVVGSVFIVMPDSFIKGLLNRGADKVLDDKDKEGEE